MRYKFHFINHIQEYYDTDIRSWVWRADDPQTLTMKIIQADDIDKLTFTCNEALAIANGAVDVETRLFINRRLNVMDSALSISELDNMRYLTEKNFQKYNRPITLKIIETELFNKIKYIEWKSVFPHK